MSTPAGGNVVGEAEIRITADTDPAEDAIRRFARQVSRQLSNSESATRRSALGLSAVAGAAAAVGGAVPAVASLVTAVAQIGPAAAAGVTGMLAIKQATATVQLAMVGVEDAITAALDPSKPEEFAKAVEKLAPEARKFAEAVRDAAPALREFQQGVQNRVFRDFDQIVERLGTSVLPVLRTSLNGTANVLNQMAKGAANAAVNLAENGTLGQATEGANKALSNLRKVPGQIVTALGQLSAAGAPLLDRFTSEAAEKITGLSERLGRSFESGALEDAINQAGEVLKQLGRVAQNVGGIVSNVFGGLTQDGKGLFDTLEQITGAIRDATGTSEFQEALRSLSGVASQLATTLGELINQAIKTLGPAITELGPPVERLIKNLGEFLKPVLEGLKPVLGEVAKTLGEFFDAIGPLLPALGQIAKEALPLLVPLIRELGEIFKANAPFIKEVAEALQSVLVPAFQLLQIVLPLITEPLSFFAQTIMPLLAEVLRELQPSLDEFGRALSDMAVELKPIVEELLKQFAQVMKELGPVIKPLAKDIAAIIGPLIQLGTGALRVIVIPALQAFNALLSGDTAGALEGFNRKVNETVIFVQTFFRRLPGAVGQVLGDFVNRVRNAASRQAEALGQQARRGVENAIAFFRSLPARAASALSGNALFSAGVNLVLGLANGIRAAAGQAVSAAVGVVGSAISAARNRLGISSPSKVFKKIGEQVGQGFIRGLTGSASDIKQTVDKLIRLITDAFKGTGSKVDDRLVAALKKGNTELVALAGQREKILQKLAEATKFAAEVSKQAQDAFSLRAITQGVEGTSIARIRAGLQRGIDAIKTFAANLEILRKKGLRKDLLEQIIGLGPIEGAQLASTLAGAGKTTIAEINNLQKQLVTESNKLGKNSADALFDAGKNAAKGFLEGLKGQKKEIEQLMIDIAQGLQKAIKKALGIKSPSTVMAEVGKDTGLGFIKGFKGTEAEAQHALLRLPRLIAPAVEGVQDLLRNVNREIPRLDRNLDRLPDPNLIARTVGFRPTVAAPAPVSNIVVTITNEGVIGSQNELDDWLTRSLDRLTRQERIASLRVRP